MASEPAQLAALNKAAATQSPTAQAKTLCDRYKSTRRWLVIALPLIKKIPAVGAQIGIVIEFLMQIADTACPQGITQARRRPRPPGRVQDLLGIPFPQSVLRRMRSRAPSNP
jgi:hypothetical protein